MGAVLVGAVELVGSERIASLGVSHPRVVTGVTVGAEPITGLDGKALRAELRARSSSWLDAPMRLESALQSFDTTPRELGAMHDPRQAVHEALAWGRHASLIERVKERLLARTEGIEIPMRARINRAATREVLEKLAPSLHREATPGRVDLKAKRFLPPTPARGLLVEETIPRVALAMAQGQDRVPLATYAMIPPERSGRAQAFPKISTVVGQARVKLDPKCPEDLGRKDNRARAISVLDGWVVEPQSRLSLWSVLGEPTIQRGFSIAAACPPNALPPRTDHGLTTLASAVWSAGFFAGMDLLQSALPEDRIYDVELGLDAFLRWPSADVELGNPHPFALVLHIEEDDQGLLVQWLGASRPFKISFEREILKRKNFETITRPDPKALLGSKTTLRSGRPGYALQRRRIWKLPGQPDRVEIISLNYAPRSAIVSVGEDPLGPPPSPEKELATGVDAEDPIVRLTQ